MLKKFLLTSPITIICIYVLSGCGGNKAEAPFLQRIADGFSQTENINTTSQADTGLPGTSNIRLNRHQRSSTLPRTEGHTKSAAQLLKERNQNRPSGVEIIQAKRGTACRAGAIRTGARRARATRAGASRGRARRAGAIRGIG